MRGVRGGTGALVLALALFAAYGWRAVTGIPGGLAYTRGARAAAAGDYATASRALGGAAIGGNAFEARWLAGQVALRTWDSGAGRREELAKAVAPFLAAWAACPSSSWPRTGLAEVYARAAAAGPLDLGRLRSDPWPGLDDDGRLAMGLVRRAVAHEPNMAWHRDALVRVAVTVGLFEEAISAAREAGRVMPDLRAHDFGTADPPREILLAFAEGSRSVLGKTPLLTRGGHLLALGLLQERLGDLPRAEADLRASLREPGTELALAERRFHLGRILVARSRQREGETLLAQAAARPEFAPAVASLRAGLAESRGDLAAALGHLRTLRRLRPEDASASLEFGRVAIAAREFGPAREALGWAGVLAPTDAGVHALLVDLAMAEGNPRAAATALADYERLGGDPGWAAQQRERIRRVDAE